jgi:recombination protein RecT
MTTEETKNKLAKRAQSPVKGADPSQTIAAYLERMKPQIALAIPKHITPDRLARVALTTIRTNPALLDCSIASLMGAIMQAAQLGLEPGLLGHCYIIPYGKEAQFIIGYKGMIDLARRSGNVKSIAAREVYENDLFHVTYNIGAEVDDMTHTPWFSRESEGFTDPGELRGVYVIAKFNDGGYHFHYMTKKQIDDHRKRSKASAKGPWVTDYIEMAKKTVVRSAWKWLPISIEVAGSVNADETIKTQIDKDMIELPDESDIINGHVVEEEEKKEEVVKDERLENPPWGPNDPVWNESNGNQVAK